MYLGVLHTQNSRRCGLQTCGVQGSYFFGGSKLDTYLRLNAHQLLLFQGFISAMFLSLNVSISHDSLLGLINLQGLRFTFLGVEAHMFFGFGTYMSQGEGSQAFENHSCFWTCRKYVDLWVQSLRFIVFWPLNFIDAQGCEAQMILGFGAYILWTVKAPKSFQILES